MQQPIVIKISGANLDNSDFVESLADTIQKMSVPVILVHGGGKAITALQEQMAIQARYVDGLRVTDEASLQITLMVLCGTVNTSLVSTLQRMGVEAQGLNGMDRGLIRAHRLNHPAADLGRVGIPYAVRAEILNNLIQQQVTPVIAPICLGEDGPYNVNADHVAGAVATAVDAKSVYFITNVPGVMADGEIIHQLTATEAETLIDQNIIQGGMIPKIRTALELIASGVSQVIITSLEGMQSGSGTALISNNTLAAAV